MACSYSYSYPTSKDNEQEKIYFRSFLNNDLNGNKRSLENKAKTEKLLPDAHKVIGTRNISVCFTHTPKDEQKKKKRLRLNLMNSKLKFSLKEPGINCPVLYIFFEEYILYVILKYGPTEHEKITNFKI